MRLLYLKCTKIRFRPGFTRTRYPLLPIHSWSYRGRAESDGNWERKERRRRESMERKTADDRGKKKCQEKGGNSPVCIEILGTPLLRARTSVLIFMKSGQTFWKLSKKVIEQTDDTTGTVIKNESQILDLAGFVREMSTEERTNHEQLKSFARTSLLSTICCVKATISTLCSVVLHCHGPFTTDSNEQLSLLWMKFDIQHD